MSSCSSPLSSIQSGHPVSSSHTSETSRLLKSKKYRPVRPLPYELRDHTYVYIEEELYSQAISLLLNTLIAGNDGTSDGRFLPAYCPPHQVLAIAATLVVHPTWTTRAQEPDKQKVANDALFLLRHVNAIVGPTNANFGAAFRFSDGRRDRRRRTGEGVVDGDVDDESKLRVDLATQGAVWNRAEDFWAVVGWAFNCSSQYPKRWERWRPWLQFMLDVLEDDLRERVRLSKTSEDGDDDTANASLFSESLIAQYLANMGEGRAGKRRVMRAILADGSKKSLDEFGEIWKNETKPPKSQKEELRPQKRTKINVDEDEYGDYMDQDDEDDDGDPPVSSDQTTSIRTSTRKRGRPKSTTLALEADSMTEDMPRDYGGADSIQLRKRFIALLTRISTVYEQAFLELEDCFDLLTEFIRPLPLSIFTQFILPSTPYLDTDSQANLCQNLMRPLISSDAPTYHALTMSQAEFEKHFLPFSANYTNFVENARVGLLVESLLRLLIRHTEVKVTSGFKKLLEEGIKARESKARFGARKFVGAKEAEEEKAVKILELSAKRMRVIVRMAIAEG